MGANAQTSVPLFTAGDVLTAANQNLSAGTGVPVFATTTTRDAAFGGTGEKVLAEGQLCYVENLTGVAQLQYYDGSTWNSLTAGGLTFIAGASFTSSAAVNVNNVFTSTYRNYKIVIEGTSGTVNGDFCDMRLRVGGADNSTANYFWMYDYVNSGAVESIQGLGGQTYWRLFAAGNNVFSCELIVTTPQLAAKHTFTAKFASSATNSAISGITGGAFGADTSFDGFSLLPSSGTITGTYRVYGLADS